MPVVGVITPEAHAAVQATRNRRVGLLATAATVEAGRYAELVHALDAGVSFHPVACPRLVPLIEGDDPYGEETEAAVREYAAPLQEAGVDTVILGCTHYPLIRKIFERVFGRDVTLVFSAEETAREVAETLARKGGENDARPRRRVPLPHDRRPGGLPRARRAASSSSRSARSSTSRWRRWKGSGMTRAKAAGEPDELRAISFEPDYPREPARLGR